MKKFLSFALVLAAVLSATQLLSAPDLVIVNALTDRTITIYEDGDVEAIQGTKKGDLALYYQKRGDSVMEID